MIQKKKRHVHTIRHTKSCYSVCTRIKIIFLLVQANITSRAFGVSKFSSFKRLNLLRVKSFGLLPTMFWVCVVCSQTIYFPFRGRWVHVGKKSARGGGFPALLGVYTILCNFPLVPSEEYNTYPIDGSYFVATTCNTIYYHLTNRI